MFETSSADEEDDASIYTDLTSSIREVIVNRDSLATEALELHQILFDIRRRSSEIQSECIGI